MDSFAEWIKTANHPCFEHWGDKAVELGASWDSFRRADKNAIVTDLVQGGIPIMAARDMTEIAAAEVTKNQSPMAVFWDLENMPLPTDTSARVVSSRFWPLTATWSNSGATRAVDSITFRWKNDSICSCPGAISSIVRITDARKWPTR
jgi:hypothetical protein